MATGSRSTVLKYHINSIISYLTYYELGYGTLNTVVRKALRYGITIQQTIKPYQESYTV